MQEQDGHANQSGPNRRGVTHPPTAELLARLVEFDTTSRNSNIPLIGFIRALFDRNGVAYRVGTDAAAGKANLHAIIGPRQAGGIALSGHVDTVPVDGQSWSGDPFVLRRDAGRLTARGACDMKGFVAACLAAIPHLQTRGLRRPLHLLITYDEEVGCHGARRLIDDLAVSGLAPAMCIVGEPSGMQPILAHKGKRSVLVRVRGKPGHSSDPAKGVNAVHAAAEAIAHVAAEARRFAAEGPFEDGFDPPHSTVHVGTVSGGTILNIIPEHAEFAMEWRTIAADDPDRELARLKAHVARAIEPAMRAVSPEAGFTFDVTLAMPAMSLPTDHALAALVRQLTGSNSTGKVSYGTEGGFYQAAGIPTIICGPGHIAQAHQPDEWVAEDELAECDAFIRRLGDRLASE